jgi:uncharacterized protein YggT (Ycf19 family)
MARLLLALILAAGLTWLWMSSSRDAIGFAVSTAGLIVPFIADDLKVIFKKLAQWSAQGSLRGRLASVLSALVRILRRAAPAFHYADFSVVIASLLILCLALFNSFVAEVRDLVAKGFLSFDPEMRGFVHLQVEMAGYLYIPPLLLACAFYGFYRGARDERFSFGKLLLAILWGFLAGSVLVSLIYGGFTGLDNYRIVTQATPNTLPSGATATSPANLVGFAAAAWMAYAALGWSFAWLGKRVRRYLSRAGAEAPAQVSNTTLQS